MPVDLVLVRHGESEGNVAVGLAKNGDTSAYTEEFTTTPGRRWRLTSIGRAQAACAGAWINEQFGPPHGGGFDRHYVSPYVRTKETAALLGLRHTTADQPQWYLNRGLRERDWGDIGSIPRTEFETLPQYAHNRIQRSIDPLYWVPPGGESIAHVAENRVRNFLDTLHRETDGQRVITVTHGEYMWATRLVLERIDDDQFVDLDNDPAQRIRNCEVLHYTRRNPDDGHVHGRLGWLRRARPVLDPTTAMWQMQAADWQPIEFRTYDNDALLDNLSSPVSEALCM